MIDVNSNFSSRMLLRLAADAGVPSIHVVRREDQADLYADIMDRLGIDGSAIVVGASEGGFIGTNFALYAPERVEKLALLGPMGYAGAIQSIATSSGQK